MILFPCHRQKLRPQCRIQQHSSKSIQIEYGDYRTIVGLPQQDIAKALKGHSGVKRKIAQVLRHTPFIQYQRMSFFQAITRLWRHHLVCDDDRFLLLRDCRGYRFQQRRSVLAAAKIRGTRLYDPVIALEVLTSLIPEEIRLGNLYELMSSIAKNDPERFARLAEVFLQQNLYVTQNAVSSLEPALKHPRLAADMTDFIRAERGHDALLWDSINALPVTEHNAAVFTESKNLMAELKHVAEHHPFAFVVAIAVMEESGNEETHPLAKIFMETPGFEQAACGIQKHQQINLQGNHKHEAFLMAEKLGPLNKKSITNGIFAFFNIAMTVQKIHMKLMEEVIKELQQEGA